MTDKTAIDDALELLDWAVCPRVEMEPYVDAKMAVKLLAEYHETIRTALEAAKALIEDSGWRCVKEETPPEDKRVSVLFDEPFFGGITKEQHIGFFDSEENKWMFDLPMIIGEKEIFNVTHWKPLDSDTRALEILNKIGGDDE